MHVDGHVVNSLKSSVKYFSVKLINLGISYNDGKLADRKVGSVL